MSRIAQIRATNHPLKDPLRSYYHSCPLDTSKVPDVKFRHFRLRLLDATFHKVKQKIRSSEDLREYLTKYVPMDVYYSTATWLNPHLIASRLDKDLLKNIYLSCDLSFDIDVSNKIRTLAEAQTQAATVLDFLESKGFKNRYIAFSGSKSFHIVCDDPWA
jgi:DNA primase catalytic subunit